jgi:uncharacterized membrane protein
MEGLVFLLFLLVLATLVASIVAASNFSRLRSSLDELRKRVAVLETQGVKSAERPAKTAEPPPLPAFLKPPPVSVSDKAPPPSVRQGLPPPVNWESILGVKLFAWIGGLALFLGVVFFVKYAFENNFITPVMRIVAGAIVGVLLIGIGVIPALRRYRVPAQSVCATGVLILYADTYAAYSFYDLIPLTLTTALMWILTGVALVLAIRLDAQSVAWLALVGGFLTPFLLRTGYDQPIVLFGYIGVLSCGLAAVSALKRWNYLILLAAIGSVFIEFTSAADFFGQTNADAARIVFLVIQALFLAICIALTWAKSNDNWGIAAAAVAGFAPLLSFIQDPGNNLEAGDFGFLTLLLSGAGLVGLAAAHRTVAEKSKGPAAIVGTALALTWLAEWSWQARVFFGPGLNDAPLIVEPRIIQLASWHVAIFMLFAATPYLCGSKRLWPWMIAAIAGPLQFWFVHRLVKSHFSHDWLWLLPIAFALPASGGVFYLVKRQHVDLSSGDARLASQAAAVLAFISLVFPVQFQCEWITLGWAIEGLALVLLFRAIPNRRLRAVALIVLSAAFVRLALNPAVLKYHPRSHTPILNWYLYAYGIAAICFFLSALWFGQPREKQYERNAAPMLYALAGIVCFLLMNIEIADYFSIGPTLTFSFAGNFARDMTYTIAWAAFAFALLIIGIGGSVRGARIAAIALLCCALAKLFLHDLDSLNQLYRIAAFISVAIIAILASFAYQRFLSPTAKS